MITPISVNTILAVFGVSGLLLFATPFAPILVLGFQAGIFVGIFLHSAHTSECVNHQSQEVAK